MKTIPASYCTWCEEKLATQESFPHCSPECKKLERNAKWKKDGTR